MFLHSWGCLQAYAFAPVAIIPLVLAMLRASSGTALPLVAPLWALRPWFPDLLQHWLDHTVVIRSRRELLYIPRSRHLSRISVGSGISLSASPAFYQNCWITLRYSGAVFAGAPYFLARCLSGAMVHFSSMVPLQWLLCLSSYLRLGS